MDVTSACVIRKNVIDEIRVAWSEYRGRTYLDIRTYTDIDGTYVPTKRGITLAPRLLPELQAALEKAAAGAPVPEQVEREVGT